MLEMEGITTGTGRRNSIRLAKLIKDKSTTSNDEQTLHDNVY
jgi:hypothetical protein